MRRDGSVLSDLYELCLEDSQYRPGQWNDLRPPRPPHPSQHQPGGHRHRGGQSRPVERTEHYKY